MMMKNNREIESVEKGGQQKGRDWHKIKQAEAGFKLKMYRPNKDDVLFEHTGDFIVDGQKIKDVRYGSGIFKRDGKWMVFFGPTKESSNLIDPVVIPDEVARIVRTALYAEYRRYRLEEDESKRIDDEDRFKIINEETKEKCFDIGCHSFVAYSMGVVDLDKEGDYIWKDAEPFFDRNKYQSFDNIKNFNNYVVKSLGNEKFGVGQALIKGTKKLHHSFLVGVSVSGKDILSIEKENIGISPFKIVPLKIFFAGPHFNKQGDKVNLEYSVKSFSEAKNILKDYSKIKK